MRTMRKSTVLTSLFVLTSLVLWFQNCSQVNFGAAVPGTSSAASTSPPPDVDHTSYAWVSGGWGSCSKSCGGGTQVQTVVCQRNDGVAVDESFCDGDKPASAQTCNTEACEVDHWVTSGFGACSVSCGGGIQTQTVSCQNQNGTVVDASHCSQPAPAPSQACNVQECLIYSWMASGFGACSVACGGGTQSQTVNCQDNHGSVVDNSLCAGTPPVANQTCNQQTCLTYNWSASGYGACSATCGGGTQTQTVVCKDSNGTVVQDSFCTGAKPAVAQTCNPQACVTYHWQQGGWGLCSVACGGGTQTQSVTCVDSNGNTVANGNCAGAPPASVQACNTQACPPPTHASSCQGGTYGHCIVPSTSGPTGFGWGTCENGYPGNCQYNCHLEYQYGMYIALYVGSTCGGLGTYQGNVYRYSYP